MSLMVASTRWNDELSCSCSCCAPWLDWLCSWGAQLSVASENSVREMQSFIISPPRGVVRNYIRRRGANPERRKLSDRRMGGVKQPLCMGEISRSQVVLSSEP